MKTFCLKLKQSILPFNSNQIQNKFWVSARNNNSKILKNMSSEMDFEVSQSRNETRSYEPQKIKSKKHVQFNSNVLSHHFLTIYRHNQNPTSETITEKLKSETEQQVCIFMIFPRTFFSLNWSFQMNNKKLRNAHMELLTTKFQKCSIDEWNVRIFKIVFFFGFHDFCINFRFFSSIWRIFYGFTSGYTHRGTID